MNEKQRLAQQCALLCDTLSTQLEIERDALIHFQVEELLENQLRKEETLAQLTELHKKFHSDFSKEELAAFNGHPDYIQWKKSWEGLKESTLRNQRMLEASIVQSEKLAEHLKKSLGIPSRYTSKGQQIQQAPQGKTVHGRV